MKRRLFVALILSALILMSSLFADAETGTFLLEEIGDCRKFATQRSLIVPPRGPSATVYSNFGVMDKDGNVVVKPVYQAIYGFKDGRSLFQINGLYGFFDESWNVVIEPKYRGAGQFSEGLACVTDESWAYGFIDTDGNTVVPHIYDFALSFENGLATVGYTDKGYNFNTFTRTGKIDKSGKLVQPIKYDWENEYDVQMSANNVRLNGYTYENEKLAYPYINYLGYTYIPLTFYGAMEMGFASHWTPETGLVLTSYRSSDNLPYNDGAALDNLCGKNTMKKGEMFKASLYKGKLSINGKVYTADDIYYPLLTCNDIIYIPVLWKQGMEGLGLRYSYDLDSRSLIIDTGFTG